MTKSMNEAITIPFSLKSLLKKAPALVKPRTGFINASDSYLIRIFVPEDAVHLVSYEVADYSIVLKTGTHHKTIHFPCKADTLNIKTSYQEGALCIHIPKIQETPSEKINRIALAHV